MITRPILFLDIDGVLIAYPEGEFTPPTFTPRCVDAFRSILDAVPRLRIVFSSTWRWSEHVNRLHEQWLSHDLPANIAIDGTPDLRGDETVSRMELRGREIERWLQGNPDVRRWAVVDDERLGIQPVLGSSRCVFTDPRRGLTDTDAERVVAVLMRAT